MMSKSVLFVMLGLFWVAAAANAVVIVDDDVEGAGDAVADFAGQIVTAWAGCENQSAGYWRFSNYADEEPGIGIDGDELPLEVLNGTIVGKLHGAAPKTANVTYAGTIERGIYTVRMQVGHLNWHGPIQAADMEITLGGMMPTSVDAPELVGDNDVVWTFIYEAGPADVGQPLTFQIHIPATFASNSTFLFDHVEIDLLSVAKASDPTPYDGQGVFDTNPVSGTDSVVLSWTRGLAENPNDPNLLIPNSDVTGYYVYVNDEPNMADVTPVSTTTESLPMGVVGYNTVKFWRVDQIINNAPLGSPDNIIGFVWSFASETAFPTVDAGTDLYTSLTLAQAGLTLNGSYLDNDHTATTSTWQVLTGDINYPGGIQSFGDASSPVTTFTTDTAGRFFLKLSVTDPDYPGVEYSDIVQVDVIEDECAAAKNSPDGYARNPHDFNDDCVVNLLDFVMFAGDWLSDTLLDAPVEHEEQ